MRFFKPTATFWQWLESHRTSRIIDIGCGRGDLVREMDGRDFKVIGVDPRFVLLDEEIPPDLANRILPLPIESAANLLKSDAVLLCCRPCHNGFPANVAAMKPQGTPLFYIGFEQNLFRDLDDHAAAATLLMTGAGEDNESIYQVA